MKMRNDLKKILYELRIDATVQVIEMVRTLHFKLHTMQCIYCTANFIVYTVHSTQYTVHSTLYTVHCTQYTVHSTLYTVHSTLYTVHCTQHTVHCTQHTVHYTAINIKKRDSKSRKWKDNATMPFFAILSA